MLSSRPRAALASAIFALGLVACGSDARLELQKLDASTGLAGEWAAANALTGRTQRGDGFRLESGATRSFRLRLEQGSELRFGLARVEAEPGPAEAIEGAGQLQVFLGEDLVWSGADAGWVALPFGADRAGAGLLRFEARGGGGAFEIEQPLLVPAGAAERRAADPRPDVLLFVADTLRRDALGVYGGPEDLTPTLDALAREGLVLEALASSSWTLPSHGSMLTALQPHQHGAVAPERALPSVATLAEVFRAAGYRTGAVTNGAFVSPAYGMDRGFERFEVFGSDDLEGTLRAGADFLARRDVRPTLLLLHTYRVHTPYHARPVALEHVPEPLTPARGEAVQRGLLVAARTFADPPGSGAPLLRLVRQGRWGEVVERFLANASLPADAVDEEVAGPLHGLYLAGVHELDRGVAAFREELERTGSAERLVTLFTSDHGEAFHDEGEWFHGLGVSDAVLRVPLWLHGPGVPQGLRAGPASLVDVPRTLSDLAGVDPAAGWGGRSLLDADPDSADAVALSFDCAAPGRARLRLSGTDWRIVLPDPGREGLDANGIDWAAAVVEGTPPFALDASELRTRFEPLLRAAYRPAASSSEPARPGEASGLDALGY